MDSALRVARRRDIAIIFIPFLNCATSLPMTLNHLPLIDHLGDQFPELVSHHLRLIALKLVKRSASFAINYNNKLRTVPHLIWVPSTHGVRDVVHLSLACAVICAFTSNSSGEQERHRRYRRTSNIHTYIAYLYIFFVSFLWCCRVACNV